MFVIMALVTTVITSPATSALYPPWYQKKLEAWKRGDIDWEGNELRASASSLEKLESTQIRKILVYLRLESLPALFTFIDLLGGEKPAPVSRVHKSRLPAVPEDPSDSHTPQHALQVHGARLLPLTERTSSVMKVSAADDSSSDPILNTFRTFARLNALPVSGTISTVPVTSFASELLSKTSSLAPDLLLVPWPSSLPADSDADAPTQKLAPFAPGAHSAFISELISEAPCNAAILIDRSFGAPVSSADRGHHIFFPFVGGADDRVALRLVLQLAKNRHVTATVLQVIHTAAPEVKLPSPVATPGVAGEAFAPRLGMGSRRSSRTSVVATAEEAMRGILERREADAAFLCALRDSLPAGLGERVVFLEGEGGQAVVDTAKREVGGVGDLVVVGRGIGGEGEVGRVLGGLAGDMVEAGVGGSLVVIKAGGRGLEM